MVPKEATTENEGLLWFRRALAAERTLDALRARVPENVSELPSRPRRARVRAAEQAIVRMRGTA